MSGAGSKAFLSALSAPAAPVSAMVEFFERDAPWEGQTSPGKVDTGLQEKRKRGKGTRKGFAGPDEAAPAPMRITTGFHRQRIRLWDIEPPESDLLCRLDCQRALSMWPEAALAPY